MHQDNESIAIIGAGALGAIYGSLLYQASPESVSFIASKERYERLKQDGVVVNGKRYVIPVTSAERAVPVDLIIVVVKDYHLDQAIADMKLAVGPGTTILSLMNGIDSEERIGAVYAMDRVLYGLALGIDAVRNGNSVSYSNQGRIMFGEKINVTVSDRVKKISGTFERAGIAHAIPNDIIRTLWFKYMINVGVNQVSAVNRATYGELRNSDEAKERMDSAMREVIAIAKALRVDLAEADIEEWYKVLATLDAAGKTSMLQDVEAGRKTEVDMLAGTVIKLGRRYGIATPVNDLLFKELKTAE